MEIGYVSTVDHAAVLGVPQRTADGRFVIGPGLGRPLIISILEDDAAMRVLTGGATRRSRFAIAALVTAGVCFAVAVGLWLADALIGGGTAVALAASPEPSVRPGSDTRSSGAGPGLVGDPLFAVLLVVAIAALSVVASLGWIRLTSGRREPAAPRR
jgi:hypothetical protein